MLKLQHDGGLLPDIIVLFLFEHDRGTRLNEFLFKQRIFLTKHFDSLPPHGVDAGKVWRFGGVIDSPYFYVQAICIHT